MAGKFDPAASHPRPSVRPAAHAPRAAESASGFTPMADLLREMGLTPRAPVSDAPLVAPHGPETAEFQPPRRLRRPPTAFAHLRAEDPAED